MKNLYFVGNIIDAEVVMRKKLDVIDVNQRSVSAQTELTLEERRRHRQRQRARQLAIKRRRRKRILQSFVFVVVSVFVLIVAGKSLFPVKEDSKEEGLSVADTFSSSIGAEVEGKEKILYEVKYEDFFEKNKPEQLSDAEVNRCLKKLAKEYPELQEIYEHRESYPLKLLVSLCNNPELHEYVKGYLLYQNGDTTIAKKPELTKTEKEQKYPLFLQWDKRWGYAMYGEFRILSNGTGLRNIAFGLREPLK